MAIISRNNFFGTFSKYLLTSTRDSIFYFALSLGVIVANSQGFLA